MSAPQPTEIPPFPPDLDERERAVLADYDWAVWDPEIQQKYAGRFIAVFDRQVLGVGDTHGDACRAAMQHPGCPGRERLAKVYVNGAVPLGERP
jgi:hypothetical protein